MWFNKTSKLPFFFHKKKKQKGVVAIEFALGFMGFWLMCMAWVEMSYMSYVSAIGDLAIAEASREAKKDNDTYLASFQAVLNRDDSIWSNIVDSNNFVTTIRYVKDVDELVSVVDGCEPSQNQTSAECGSADKSSIAIYRISYDFDSMFTYFMDQTTVFTREVIVIQEYERSQFGI